MVMVELCPLPTADCLLFWRPASVASSAKTLRLSNSHRAASTPCPTAHCPPLGIHFHPWPEILTMKIVK
jgi:hypothetical protein